MKIIGIDLAKNIFHVCVMDKSGKVYKRFKSNRLNLIEEVKKQGKGIVAMEACGSSHYWGRAFREHGYEVRIIPAQFVKPFVKSNKNDEIDAEAICEAAGRPQMRFVSIRSEWQQDIQNLHRIRERLVGNKVALINQIRGFLLEYGMVAPKGKLRESLLELVESASANKSSMWKETFQSLYEELCYLEERISHYEKRLKSIAKEEETCKRVDEITGVGYLTATAIVAAVGNPNDFKNGRQFAAWLGLTPKQHSTGGKQSLGSISKRGNSYIRKLLVQGARSSAIAAERKKKTDITSKWLFKVAASRGSNRAVVALANKTARRIWVVLCGKTFMLPEELKMAA
jgi:transposase